MLQRRCCTVDAEDAARVEVVHGELRLAGGFRAGARVVDAILVGEADDGDGVGEVGVLGAGAVDEEVFAFQPFDGDGAVDDDTGQCGMGGFGGPASDQAIERCQCGFGCHRGDWLSTSRSVVAVVRGSSARR